MKSRRLTETDLANMSFMPSSVKRARLETYIKPKKIIGSYEPFRSTIGDALNEQFPFLQEERDPTSLGTLEAVVGRACKGDQDLLSMNLAVARATHEFALKRELSAERHELRSMTVAFGHKYTFGMPLILRAGGDAFAAFPDLRRTGPLTSRGCLFVVSMMHQRLRVNYPDLRRMLLEIWRYSNSVSRTVRGIEVPDAHLIPYDDLLADITETYKKKM